MTFLSILVSLVHPSQGFLASSPQKRLSSHLGLRAGSWGNLDWHALQEQDGAGRQEGDVSAANIFAHS